jgi:catechol 2,3-dioxygenase-like lactoylglutathione lyase family enzyme
VARLGHIGLGVTDLRRSERWYKDRFGLLTSDEIEIRPGELTGTFLRRDHGAAAVDHHTLVLAQFRKAPRFLHAAFEVPDLDDVMLGHAFLKSLQHTHVWGVGRHILGSQVFDYWQDPWGHELEHWTDGDLLTADDPPGRASLEQSLASQWGSSHPGLAAVRGSRS